MSALGKVLEGHGDLVDGPAVGAVWVNALPLTADTVEAKVVHSQLVRMIEASDARWVGREWGPADT